MCSCVQSACDWEGSRQTSVLVAGTPDQLQLSKSQLVHLLGRLPRYQWGSKMQLRARQRLYMKAAAIHHAADESSPGSTEFCCGSGAPRHLA